MAILLVAAAAACSSSSKGGSSLADAGEADDVAVVEAGGETGDYYDAGYEPEAGPAGFVFFSMAEDGTGTVGAVFDGTPVAASRCRLTSTYGACAVFACPSPADAGATPAAGTLTFAAPSLDAGETVDADPTGFYEVTTPAPLFAPGDTLTVTASGGAVPAFGPTTVTAPGSIALASPALDGGALAVPTGSDLGLSWTGGSAGSLAILTASGQTADGSLVVARCSYVAITDEGTLPAQVLGSLKGLSQGTVGWGQANIATIDAGAWEIGVFAGAYASTPASFQ